MASRDVANSMHHVKDMALSSPYVTNKLREPRASVRDTSDLITEIEDQDEFDALAAIMNGNFRNHSLTRPVHSNIENTAFVAAVRLDGHTQVISKQTICWFLEEVVWKVSSDRKKRFTSCLLVFFQRKLTIKNVERLMVPTTSSGKF